MIPKLDVSSREILLSAHASRRMWNKLKLDSIEAVGKCGCTCIEERKQERNVDVGMQKLWHNVLGMNGISHNVPCIGIR